MIEVFQESNYPTGDCFSSCVASITERTDVPNFMVDGEAHFDHNLSKWLKEEGYRYYHIKYDTECYAPPFAMDGLCIFTGEGKHGGYHSVVGKVVYSNGIRNLYYMHDPIKNGQHLKSINTIGFIVSDINTEKEKELICDHCRKIVGYTNNGKCWDCLTRNIKTVESKPDITNR